jgi:hypothetical protein
MIHEFFRFEGFDAPSHAALVQLLRPSRASRAAREAAERTTAKRTGLLVVVVDEEGAVLGATHSRRGRIVGIRSGNDPEALAHVHKAARVIVLRDGALDDLAERVALRVRREQDYLDQLFTVVESIRELERAGTVRMHPGTFARVPMPSPDTIRRALDLIASDGKAFVVCLHDDRRLTHAFALRRRGGAFDAIIGPRILRRWAESAGPMPGTFEGDHHAIVAGVDRELAPVQLAISLREGVAHKIITQRTPGALSAAVAAREVFATPAPSWLALGVGLDTLASVIYGLRQALEGTPIGDALAALAAGGDGNGLGVPGFEALESWLELFASRVRR